MGGKRISDLRVVDLRSQLEKRGLDTKGNKATLVERLSQALSTEGENAEEYVVELGTPSKEQPSTTANTTAAEDSQPLEILGDTAEGDGEEEEEEDLHDISTNSFHVVVDEPSSLTVSTDIFDKTGASAGMDSNLEVDDDKHDDKHDNQSKDEVEVEDVKEDDKEEKEDKEEEGRKEEEPCRVESAAVQPEENDVQKVADEEVEKSVEDQSIIVVDADATANTTISPDDDHDALNLTIGDEEDKFMIDEEEVSVVGTVIKSGENKDPKSSSTNSEQTKTLSAEINDKGLDSADGKRNEKSEEGGKLQPRKPKADDRNTLLVTGLSSQTAATEIKAVFKRFGKIGGVKIMSNAKDPEGSRFALVAVMSSADALVCIKNLDGFELHGRIIHVDKARDEMLSADWVRREGSHSKNKKDSKKSNGSSITATSTHVSRPTTATSTTSATAKDTVIAAENLSSIPTSSSDTPTKVPPSPVERKLSTSQKSTEIIVPTASSSAAVTEIPAASKTSDPKTKEDGGKSATTKKESSEKKVSSKTSDKKRSSTERKERKDIIPFQGRNYHFQRRPVTTGYRGGRITRGHPRFRHHDDEDRGRDRDRDDYHHNRRSSYHPEERVLRHHSPPSSYRTQRMVKRSRSPPERIPYRRGTPPEGGRRMGGGRQPELTFEEIYDTRQREKDREMERERREIERRRMEEEEKQRLLDEEFRRLAKERERIEAEKAELKRQKEKMIMEEREKQRVEQAEIEREKALLAARKSKSSNKRSHLGMDEYGREDHMKKQALVGGRSRHGGGGGLGTSSSYGGVDALRLRRGDEVVSRYPGGQIGRMSEGGGGTMRGAPLRNAPIRDRQSPSWEKDRRSGRDGKGVDRHSHRGGERDHGKTRDDSKAFPITTVASDSAGNRYAYASTQFASGIVANPSGRIVTAITKPIDFYTGNTSVTGRGDSNRWPASSSSFLGGGESSMTNLRQQPDSWMSSSRDPASWAGSERIATRTVAELSDRWGGGGTSSRLGIPAPPPPPIFSNASELTMNSVSGNSFNPGMYASSYDYKLPSMPSHRRQ